MCAYTHAHTNRDVCVCGGGGGFLAQLLAYNIMKCKLFSHMSPRHKASMNLTACLQKKTLKENTMKTSFKSEMFNKIHVKIK